MGLLVASSSCPLPACCLTAASLMESGAYVNEGKLKYLSKCKSLNQQKFAKALDREPDLVCRSRNGKLLET